MAHEAIDERDPFSILAANEEGGEERGLQGVLCVEAIVALLEFGAASPKKARTVCARIEHPEATLAQMAEKLGITAPAVHQHLTAAKRELGHLIFNGKAASSQNKTVQQHHGITVLQSNRGTVEPEKA